MKIILGGAQIGMKYGVSNVSAFSRENSYDLLQNALKTGINTIDIASNYGASHEIIREFGVDHFMIHSKLPSIKGYNNSHRNIDVEYRILFELEKLLKELNTDSIHTLYFHSEDDIEIANDPKIYDLLKSLKKEGVIKSFGASIYSKNNLNDVFDTVQIPLNYIQGNDMLNIYKPLKTVICRSIFLQGVLLGTGNLEKDFINKHGLSNWHNFLDSKGINPLQLCLAYAKMNCSSIVLGFDNSEQLLETMELINNVNDKALRDILEEEMWRNYILQLDILKDPRLW